jgi:hypothetical protein
MLHSYIAGSRGRTYSSPCYITCRSYTLYGFQDKRINGRKHLPWTYKRLPRHHISPSSKTRSRRKQIQHQQCVKKASSSGPAAAPTSKTHAPAPKPVSATKSATATLSPGHTALQSLSTLLYAVPPASAPMKPQHCDKQTKLYLPLPPPILL